MKKFFAILFVAVFVTLSFSACTSSNGSGEATKDSAPTASENGKTEGTPNDNKVVINGNTVELRYETNHSDLYYKENVAELTSDTMGSVRNITYNKDGEDVFVIRLGLCTSAGKW